jgi:hypothetical protein
MIGTEIKWGNNSAYITGFEKSSMGSILQKNLEGSAFKFYPDPYPEQQLFYRSDNATLARLEFIQFLRLKWIMNPLIIK